MSNWDFFSGQITVEIAAKKRAPKNSLDFDIPKSCKDDLKNVLMTNFKNWSFSDEEKKVLSQPIRKTLCQISHLCHNDLKAQAKSLCDLLQNTEGFKIKIKTHGYGGFVCLAALMGNKLPKNKDINIECYSVPLALFPKKLLRRKPVTVPANIKMSFLYPDQEWLSPFTTLRKCPNTIKLNNTCKVEEKDPFPKVAA